MKALVLLLSMLCLMTACSSLPEVYPDRNVSVRVCRQARGRQFPAGRWQFLHAIEAKIPGGHKGLLMGLTQISSADKTVRSVIMTLEGMVLFDARYDRHLVVNRHISPFDKENFAQGLIRDIQLIFFAPPGRPVGSGILKDGAAVCRFQTPDGRWTDIIRYDRQDWQIRQYGRQHRKKRGVKFFFNSNKINPGRFNAPERMLLTAYDPPGYTLDMKLVEAVPY